MYYYKMGEGTFGVISFVRYLRQIALIYACLQAQIGKKWIALFIYETTGGLFKQSHKEIQNIILSPVDDAPQTGKYRSAG